MAERTSVQPSLWLSPVRPSFPPPPPRLLAGRAGADGALASGLALL